VPKAAVDKNGDFFADKRKIWPARQTLAMESPTANSGPDQDGANFPLRRAIPPASNRRHNSTSPGFAYDIHLKNKAVFRTRNAGCCDTG
jgi:hypothetical protein